MGLTGSRGVVGNSGAKVNMKLVYGLTTRIQKITLNYIVKKLIVKWFLFEQKRGLLELTVKHLKFRLYDTYPFFSTFGFTKTKKIMKVFVGRRLMIQSFNRRERSETLVMMERMAKTEKWYVHDAVCTCKTPRKAL